MVQLSVVTHDIDAIGALNAVRWTQSYPST